MVQCKGTALDRATFLATLQRAQSNVICANGLSHKQLGMRQDGAVQGDCTLRREARYGLVGIMLPKVTLSECRFVGV
jgi:hypothetical protein